MNAHYNSNKNMGECEMKETGIPMRCTRPDCPKSETGWNYKGAKRYPGSTSCPYCHKQIQIPKVVVD